MSEETKIEDVTALLAAMLNGDRWLSADACAAYLGGIKRRTFLEKIACRHDFPAPSRILGTTKLWLRSEVHQWAQRQRVNRAA